MTKYSYEYFAVGQKGRPLAIWDITESIPGRLVADIRGAATEEAKIIFDALKNSEE